MAVICYKNDPVLTREKVEYRNPSFWRGEVEKGFEYIVCDRQDIAEKYKEAGVIHVDLDMQPVTGQEKDTSKIPSGLEALPDDPSSLSWPRLKSLASQKAGRNILTKAEALEVMNNE